MQFELTGTVIENKQLKKKGGNYEDVCLFRSFFSRR